MSSVCKPGFFIAT